MSICDDEKMLRLAELNQLERYVAVHFIYFVCMHARELQQNYHI